MDSIESKRSCFCIPLKRGLVLLASIKLITALLLVLYFAFRLIIIIAVFWTEQDASRVNYEFIIGLGIFAPFVMWLIDMAFTIVLIAGVHKRSVLLLRIYNSYSVLVMILASICMFLFATILRPMLVAPENISEASYVTYGTMLSALFNIVLHLYFTLVIRSELTKLDDALKYSNAKVVPIVPSAPNLENDVTLPRRELDTKDNQN